MATGFKCSFKIMLIELLTSAPSCEDMDIGNYKFYIVSCTMYKS